MRWLALLLCLCLLQPFATPSAASDFARPTGSSGELIANVTSLIGKFPGEAGVWIADPAQTVPLYTHESDSQVITASLYKLGVLLEVERLVEVGKLRYQDTVVITSADITEDGAFESAGTIFTVDEALEAMITVSDNGAALALLNMVTASAVNSTLAGYGLANFHLAVSEDEDNMATPAAVGNFFTQLALKKLISAPASERMLSRLSRQRINDRLPSALPDNVVIAHKTGNLVGVTHDAGIIFTPAGPRVVVVMTWGGEEERANALIGSIGALVYAAVLEPPANAQYVVPTTPLVAEVGTALHVPLQLTNSGSKAWGAAGTGKITLIWQIETATTPGRALIALSPAPLALPVLPAAGSATYTLDIPAPGAPGEYLISVGLADDAGALAVKGSAVASFTLRVHPVYRIGASTQLPKLLHRKEGSQLIINYSPLPTYGEQPRTLSFAWQLTDPKTKRVVAQGITPLGTFATSPGTFFGMYVAPDVSGTFILSYSLYEDGAVSVPESQKVVISHERTYGGEHSFLLPTDTAPSIPRPKPKVSGSPAATPKGKSAPPPAPGR